ncbi:DUF4383 domain-containing protein [Candidatus Pacearchaeota archaeon]|nr:DUF4383 domain-containing protein [Candidatus Pacearchaeota archaeon]
MANVQKTFALVLGIVLLLVGILGFFSNGIVSETGYFTVNTTQSVLHLIAGLFGLYVGTKGRGPGYNATLGWIGIILGVLGFIPGASDLLLSWLNITTPISVLHIVIGIVALGVYYGTRK